MLFAVMLFEKFMVSQAKRTVSLTVGKQGRKAHFIPSVSMLVKIKIVLIEKNRFILH